MLEKSAKLFNVVQTIAAVLFMYFYLSSKHPVWLLIALVLFGFSVLTSSVLNLVVLSKKRPDIRGSILRGYLDLRAFRIDATTNVSGWVHLPYGCCVKLYAELVNRNQVGAHFRPEKTSLELRVKGERFRGTWERVTPGQQAINEGRTETLNDLFDALSHDELPQGIPWNGYLGFLVENFNGALLHDKVALAANVKIRIHDTFGRIHIIKDHNIRLAIEEVYLPSEFAA